MPAAPRARPTEHAVLATFRSHVTARPRAVFDALDRRLRPGAGAQSLYLADAAASLIVAQGGWWYRAEYRIVPDERGSHVEHSIINVAQRARWASRVTARRVLRAAPTQFTSLMNGLRAELQ